MAAPWRLATSLVCLRAFLDSMAPKRSKASDGSIGDQAHRSRASDHNPNDKGVVCAIDVTSDPEGGCDGRALAEFLKTGRDARIKYVIHQGRMFSSYAAHGVPPWTWRKYTGSNPHNVHVHISVNADSADNAAPWKLGQLVTVNSTIQEREKK
jgi:hypothetical protein